MLYYMKKCKLDFIVFSLATDVHMCWHIAPQGFCEGLQVSQNVSFCLDMWFLTNLKLHEYKTAELVNTKVKVSLTKFCIYSQP